MGLNDYSINNIKKEGNIYTKEVEITTQDGWGQNSKSNNNRNNNSQRRFFIAIVILVVVIGIIYVYLLPFGGLHNYILTRGSKKYNTRDTFYYNQNVYVNIFEIEPRIALEYETYQGIRCVICRCLTDSNEHVWLVISRSLYLEYFDKEADLSSTRAFSYRKLVASDGLMCNCTIKKSSDYGSEMPVSGAFLQLNECII